MSDTWKDLDAGMFFLLRSTTRPRPFGLRPLFKDYVQNKAMCSLIQVVNVHRTDNKVTQLFIRTLGMRDLYCPGTIEAKHTTDLHTSHVKHPDLYFKDANITILK